MIYKPFISRTSKESDYGTCGILSRRMGWEQHVDWFAIRPMPPWEQVGVVSSAL
ncbi:hypothetical protein PAXRUDRAFT_832357 [Paxillus rubicundulus Ve08.2h10]|uniref:Uncharacterized protein n=1 Tax=Paxillus rubicundulus Ve08.2h10 TaxID=930991 RepID=A0A0D0DD47_9AGAM|nr:hypothetical protein PAXRUDRAFT_832357 [Paxillus rubicundulus Ve08.2h10]